MKTIITTLIIILTFGSVSAQNLAKISGSVGSNITNLNDTFYVVTLQCLDSLNYVQTTNLNSNGQYNFDAIKGKSYRITLNDIANGTKDPLNGVSTLDLVLAQRHILGISILEPRRILAADVNSDGRVTVSDMVIMRKLILGISQQFQSGKSWLYVFAPIPTAIFPFIESGEISNLSANLVDQNFIVIKLGDLNGTALWP